MPLDGLDFHDQNVQRFRVKYHIQRPWLYSNIPPFSDRNAVANAMLRNNRSLIHLSTSVTLPHLDLAAQSMPQ